jgi:hypothetical protein
VNHHDGPSRAVIQIVRGLRFTRRNDDVDVDVIKYRISSVVHHPPVSICHLFVVASVCRSHWQYPAMSIRTTPPRFVVRFVVLVSRRVHRRRRRRFDVGCHSAAASDRASDVASSYFRHLFSYRFFDGDGPPFCGTGEWCDRRRRRRTR